MSVASPKPSWLPKAAIVASIVWIAVAIAFVAGAMGCTNSNDGCLTPNELGDTLSGIFAPLAFLWLAVAVFLQRDELSAQREELALTRLEMKESRRVLDAQRKAMDAQVDEARRNVELISGQVQIQERTFSRSQEIEAARIIDDLISVAASVMRSHRPIAAFQGLPGSGFSWGIGVLEGHGDFAAVKEFNDELLRQTTLADTLRRELPTMREGVGRFREILATYEMMLVVREGVASSKRMQLSLLRIEASAQFIKVLLQAIGEPLELPQ